MNSHSATPELSQAIAQHLTCCQSLLTILERERNALIANDPPGLRQISTLKLELVKDLQRLGENLQTLQRGASIDALIDAHPAAPQLSAQWHKLMTLAHECEQANFANGALLDERQAQIRRTLNSLFSNSNTTTLYSAGGITGYRPQGRLYASA
ncbi:MAG: flagellar protein FlgN [Stenotrophobium sp.]